MPTSTRDYWILTAEKLARPILHNLAAGTLRQQMPVEKDPSTHAEENTHLEAFARLLTGLAPWLELDEPASRPWRQLTHQSLAQATDPASPDFLNFTKGRQPLVDAAFLAQALLRAPKTLWTPLPARVQSRLIQALKQVRSIRPSFNNWLLFSAMIETALRHFGETDWDALRVDYALRQHEQWYLGDGLYGDGPQLHADYYNSFVIQPMLLDIVSHQPEFRELEATLRLRAQRHTEILERLISPEGTYPPLGRSLAYRCGAFHSLAQLALQQQLPPTLPSAQVRCALTAVMRRTLEFPGTFDHQGWLRIGFCGAQPSVGECYISTGSLYLCSTVLLPLGLPPSAPFWSEPDQKWTSLKAWQGEPFPLDKALNL